MSEKISKILVIRRVLEWLAKLRPLKDAYVATLGGEGREPAIWREVQIPDNQGWIIERSPARMRRLIRSRSNGYFHIHGSLVRFPGVFRARVGNEAHLDLFHWDLCGTVEPVIDDLSAVVPLLLGEEPSLLAVTVADARRNLSQEDPWMTLVLSRKVFEEPASERLWKYLSKMHAREVERLGNEASSEKVALRELGVLTHVFRVIREQAATFQLKLVERMLYLSDGFRMRTYLFQLSPQGHAPSDALSAQTFVDGIRASRIRWIGNEPVCRVRPIPVPTLSSPVVGESEKERMTNQAQSETPPTPLEAAATRLREAMKYMSGDLRRDAETLIKAALAPRPSVPNLKALKSELEASLNVAVSNTLNRFLPESGTKPVAADQAAPPARKRGRPVGSKNAANGASAPNKAVAEAQQTRERDQIRLELLLAKQEGEGPYAKKRAEVLERLGITDAVKGKSLLAGITSRAQGKFMTEFCLRVLDTVPEGKERAKKLTELAHALGIQVKSLSNRLEKALQKQNASAAKQPPA